MRKQKLFKFGRAKKWVCVMKKHRKAKKGSAARSGKKPHKLHKLARKVRKSSKSSVRKMSVSKRASKKVRRARLQRPQPTRKQKHVSAPPVSYQKAADEVPTLEQVTITCANCGRPFKVLKLKGLSLEGTICQRCSLGEMEMPESFG